MLIGCSSTPNELKTAENLMDLRSDSALFILKNLSPRNYTSESDKALYELLLFQAQDYCFIHIETNLVFDSTLLYYQKKKDNKHLAIGYYLKANNYFNLQQNDHASEFFMKSLELNEDNNLLKGKCYASLGDIAVMQKEYDVALKKYKLAINFFKKAGNIKELHYYLISIGRVYHFQKNFKTADNYYKFVLKQNNDSLITGLAFQEIALNYYFEKKYDSAIHYFYKCFKYPCKGTSSAIRYFNLGDLYFDLEKYDSAHYYAMKSLKYPGNIYLRRNCYRLLVNYEYLKNDIKQMGVYMSKYQEYTDSVRLITAQTKSTVIENLNIKSEETKETQRDADFIIVFIIILISIIAVIAYLIYKKYLYKKVVFEEIKEELIQKNELVSKSLTRKLEETRSSQTELRKKATPKERLLLEKELYNRSLSFDDWNKFSTEMNSVFNNIITKLQTEYNNVTQKEITWCCLQLLEVSNKDKAILLNSSTDSLYKLKQRLAQKFDLKNTKDIDDFLNELAKEE